MLPPISSISLFSTFFFFFFNDTATTEIYTLSLHDALPIWRLQADDVGAVIREILGIGRLELARGADLVGGVAGHHLVDRGRQGQPLGPARSEEHTSELQSHSDLVCRLLLEKKKKKQ